MELSEYEKKYLQKPKEVYLCSSCANGCKIKYHANVIGSEFCAIHTDVYCNWFGKPFAFDKVLECNRYKREE